MVDAHERHRDWAVGSDSAVYGAPGTNGRAGALLRASSTRESPGVPGGSAAVLSFGRVSECVGRPVCRLRVAQHAPEMRDASKGRKWVLCGCGSSRHKTHQAFVGVVLRREMESVLKLMLSTIEVTKRSPS